MKVRITILFFVAVFLLGFLTFQYFQFNDGRLHIVFCDVGQGDGIFIRTPNGTDMVIDAGPNEAITSCLARHMPLWDRDIELAFATHPDADHIAGFEYVLESYGVGQFNTSQKTSGSKIFREIQQTISEKQIPLRFLFTGDTYKTADGVEIKDVWPTHAYVDAKDLNRDTNSFSLVQVLRYGKVTILLTGDIEKEILNNLFPDTVSVDVLKLPHHGSKTGVDDKTFQKIRSKLAILSVGARNRFHHPNEAILALLKKYKIPFERTDKVGDIEIVSDGREVSIVTGN